MWLYFYLSSWILLRVLYLKFMFVTSFGKFLDMMSSHTFCGLFPHYFFFHFGPIIRCVLVYKHSLLGLFIVLTDLAFFINWSFAVTLHLASLLVPSFNSVCSLHVSALPFGDSHNFSNLFITILYVMVICDQRSLMLQIVIVLKHHKLYLHKMTNLTDKCVCSNCSNDWPFLHLSPSP